MQFQELNAHFEKLPKLHCAATKRMPEAVNLTSIFTARQIAVSAYDNE